MGQDNRKENKGCGMNIMAQLRELGIEVEYADPILPYAPFVLRAKRKDKHGYSQVIEKEYDHKPTATDKYNFYKHILKHWSNLKTR